MILEIFHDESTNDIRSRVLVNHGLVMDKISRNHGSSCTHGCGKRRVIVIHISLAWVSFVQHLARHYCCDQASFCPVVNLVCGMSKDPPIRRWKWSALKQKLRFKRALIASKDMGMVLLIAALVHGKLLVRLSPSRILKSWCTRYPRASYSGRSNQPLRPWYFWPLRQHLNCAWQRSLERKELIDRLCPRLQVKAWPTR